MNDSILSDAFAHHVWATERLIDACAVLTPEQLEAPVAGTYGSIIETLRHLIASDTQNLHVLNGGTTGRIREESPTDLAELRSVIARDGIGWADVLAGELHPDEDVVPNPDDDPIGGHAPTGIRIAQVLHHGTDHRSQVCTALSSLGVTPPLIDVWDYAEANGRERGVRLSAS